MQELQIQVSWEGKASRLPGAYGRRVTRRIFTNAPDKLVATRIESQEDDKGLGRQLTLQVDDRFGEDDTIVVVEHEHTQGESVTGFHECAIPITWKWTSDHYKAHVELGADFDLSTSFYPNAMKQWCRQAGPIARRLIQESSQLTWGQRALASIRAWDTLLWRLRHKDENLPDFSGSLLMLPLSNDHGRVSHYGDLIAIRLAQHLGGTLAIPPEPLAQIGITGLQEVRVA